MFPHSFSGRRALKSKTCAEIRALTSGEQPAPILDRIGDKWTVLVVRLLVIGPLRFNALNKSIGGLSAKVLSRALRDLERDGLVTRTAFPTVPVTVEYDLTPLGRTLTRTLGALSHWAEENIEAVHTSQRQYTDKSSRR
ncbi:DNA-binding HxlR family transcriptional regulator [Aminobacter ciceronei]|uniref:DNA-binding HxlR family transcriptional regulator n=1 Tax=Aminobacter ciceronei TaxID=150723 RepID=A0ABR6CHR2_9HYPH|nr:DNA-binding HxlR family transcriptional regulator [Aminobacter ciceronei]MBA9024608.1 DNA-binding HxlR family transcriptional regulator [Aminobacter ciceronei]